MKIDLFSLIITVFIKSNQIETVPAYGIGHDCRNDLRVPGR